MEHRSSEMDPTRINPPMNRRMFLKATLGGSALLVLGGLVRAGAVTYSALPGDTLRVLNSRTAAIFNAIADALIDDGSSTRPRPSALGIHTRFDGMLLGLHPEMQRQVVLLLEAFEHLTLPFGLHLRTFTRLTLAEQKAFLEGWANSRLGVRRMVFQALKLFVHVNYYTFPETWAPLGYDGPWVGRIDVPYFEPPLASYTDEEPL